MKKFIVVLGGILFLFLGVLAQVNAAWVLTFALYIYMVLGFGPH